MRYGVVVTMKFTDNRTGDIHSHTMDVLAPSPMALDFAVLCLQGMQEAFNNGTFSGKDVASVSPDMYQKIIFAIFEGKTCKVQNGDEICFCDEDHLFRAGGYVLRPILDFFEK